MHSLKEAVEGSDPETILALCDHQLCLMVPGTPALRGTAEFRFWLEASFSKCAVNLEYELGSVTPNGELVAADGRYTLNTSSSIYTGIRVLGGNFLAVLRKGEGRWRLFRLSCTSDLPPARVRPSD